MTALDTQKQSNFDRVNGEDPYQGTSKSQGSLLCQKNRNRNSLYDRTNAAGSVSIASNDDGNEDEDNTVKQ